MTDSAAASETAIRQGSLEFLEVRIAAMVKEV